MNEDDMLVLNRHEAVVLRLLVREWGVLADLAGETRRDLLVYEKWASESDVARMRAMLEAREREMSEVVQAARFVSGGIDDVLFGDGESDWLVVE